MELFFNEDALFYPEIKCYFDERAHGDFNLFRQSFAAQHNAVLGKGYVGLISSNHDLQRLNCGRRESADLKVIFTFLLTWPAVPFIYYGEEIGMRYLKNIISKEGGYQRTGSRTPMQWDRGHNAGFSRAAPDRLYLPLDPDPSRPDAASQERDADSLWQHVRELIVLRREDPDLRPDTPIEILSKEPQGYPLVYKRGQNVIVALNPGAEQRSCLIPGSGELKPIRQHGCSLDRKEGHTAISLKGKSWGLFRGG
jgi:maltose alpha-D-glucosyltransferase/alpha-amylase